MDRIELIWMGVKIGVVVLTMLTSVPVMVWVERRGSALMQNRLGPNRVGPLGILQAPVDVVKLLFKEDFIPAHVEKFIFVLAPAVLLIPAFMTFAVVPFGGDITIDGKALHAQIADLDVGILYVFAISSLGVYGIIMAGWASNNKYSMIGSLRSSAQMISYELSLGMSVLGMIMMAESIHLRDIVAAQSGNILGFLPRWGVFTQPIGFIVFLTASFAETNRLPFDLPEGESEIVAGYHTEYGAMKFALFFMAEYINMLMASALISTLFFGGFQLLPGMGSLIEPIGALIAKFSTAGNPADWGRLALEVVSFSIKVGFFMWFFVWVRWTLPRFRYDQLMNLGWKILFPLSLANLVVTAALMYMRVI